MMPSPTFRYDRYDRPSTFRLKDLFVDNSKMEREHEEDCVIVAELSQKRYHEKSSTSGLPGIELVV